MYYAKDADCSALFTFDTDVTNLLAMLSLADILVAISHIWGSAQNLEKFIDVYYPINHTDFSKTDTQCTAQAVLAIFGTMSSLMWTFALVLFVSCVYCSCSESMFTIRYNLTLILS